MTADPAIAAALRAAAKRFCVCDGECFETRHGMMNGPCEAMIGQAAAAIEAFHMKLATYYRGHGIEPTAMFHDSMAAAARAAKGGA